MEGDLSKMDDKKMQGMLLGHTHFAGILVDDATEPQDPAGGVQVKKEQDNPEMTEFKKHIHALKLTYLIPLSLSYPLAIQKV